MRMHAARHLAVFFSLLTASVAQVKVAEPDWAVGATFAVAPKSDDQRTPTEYGEEFAERRFAEKDGERFLLMRVTYPLVPPADSRGTLYTQAIEAFMNSRRGEIHEDESLHLGDYAGKRLLIEHRRDNSFREVRLILIGGSLYFMSAEWLGGAKPTATAAAFLSSISLSGDFSNARLVEDRARWREIARGNFVLRYDASRWYRDPVAKAGDGIALLRTDQLAEVEFLAGAPVEAKTMEEVVIAAARETAERVSVRKRGKKLVGKVTVEDLRFTVRAEGQNYENHGYYYSGAEGSVQLRAWSSDKNFPQVEGDIEELLEGLNVRSVTAPR